VLTRSLGHQPEVEIDIEQHPLAIGDTLLLCSDGLWGFVSEVDIEKVVDAPGLTLESSVHGLLGLALAAGGNDTSALKWRAWWGFPKLTLLLRLPLNSSATTPLSGWF